MSQGLATTRGVGEYVASEAHTGLTSRLYKPNGTVRPVIFFTGGPGDDRDFLTDDVSGSAVAEALARAGYPVASAAFGGGDRFGNDTSITRIGQLWTLIKTRLGSATDKFIGVGTSKGFTALANYAARNPSNVASLIGMVPGVDIQDMYDNNRSGIASLIAAAYGGSRPPDDHNPADETTALAAIPQALWYASDDPVIYPPTVVAYAAATGASLSSLGAVGHSAASVDPAAVLEFI